jgi:hypothetical protein
MSSDSESVTIKSTSSRASTKATALKAIRDRFKTLRSDFDAKMKELEAAFTAEFKRGAKKSASTTKKPATLWTLWCQYVTSKYKDEFTAFRASPPEGSTATMPAFAKYLKEVTKVDEYAEFSTMDAAERTEIVTITMDANPKPVKASGRASKKAAVAEVIDEHEEEVLTSNSSSSSSSASSSAASSSTASSSAASSSSSSAAAIPKASPVAKAPVKRAAKPKATKVPKEWKLGGTTYMKNTDHQVWECSASGLGDWVGLYDTKTKTIDTGVDEPERPVMSE